MKKLLSKIFLAVFFVFGSFAGFLIPASLSYGDAPITGILFIPESSCIKTGDFSYGSITVTTDFTIKVGPEASCYGSSGYYPSGRYWVVFSSETAVDVSVDLQDENQADTIRLGTMYSSKGGQSYITGYVCTSDETIKELPLVLKAYPLYKSESFNYSGRYYEYCPECEKSASLKYKIYDLYYSYDEEFSLSDGLERDVTFWMPYYYVGSSGTSDGSDMVRYKFLGNRGDTITVQATHSNYGSTTASDWEPVGIEISAIQYYSSNTTTIQSVTSKGSANGTLTTTLTDNGDYYVTVTSPWYNKFIGYSTYNYDCPVLNDEVPVHIKITSNAKPTGDLVVNTTGDEPDADLNDGGCDVDLSSDGNQCTLRAAIQEANSREGEDTVTFESSVSAINPKKPLPDITETVTIDASSNSSSVELNGSNAGKNADGFSIANGNLTIKNLTVSGFSENGVKSDGNGYVALENVMITGNGGYGILADGAVYINSDPSNKTVLSPISTTTSVISGNGGNDGGGGMWSSKDSVNAAYVEIKDNKGAGVAAKKNIALEAFTISGNKGPGVQSLSGGISVYGTSDHSEDNQVTENHGPGIMTGTDMELKSIGSGKGKSKGNITIQTDINVSNNGGWGIIAPGGDVAVNRVDATGDWGAVSSSTSVISDNGNTTLECYTLNDKGKLVRISSAALESAGAGGIGAGGNMAGALLEVTGNNGPGIVARDNVNLKQLKVNNNRGPGIQSRKSSITINGTSDNSEENQVMENQGPGIMSGTNMALKPVGSSKNAAKGSVTITTDINVSTNGGWGIIAPEGDVAVNRIDARGTTGKISSSTSVITGNGDKTRKCYVVGEDGRLKQISSKSLESAGAGGIGAGANMAGELLEITENNGPGIAAKYEIDLVQIKANNNRGPGIQSLQGTIGINNGTSDYNEENHVAGNQGPGVMTGTEMSLSTAKFGKNVYFRTHVEVSGNAGWGIFSSLGDVVINGYDYETQGKLSSYTSYVKGNGDTSLSCYVVNKKGYLGHLKKYSAGGVACGENMAGYDLEVTDNSGTGIKVLHDLYMDTGKVCDNSEENLSVTGDIISITDVDVCE